MKFTALLTAIGILIFCEAVLAAQPDSALLKSAGIRTLKSKHLTLYTDLPTAENVDDLPKIFDAAIPLWCEFFEVKANSLADWRVTACLMRDRQKFEAYRLLPKNLPDFLNGLQRFNNVWIHEQPSDYYRRHLLLHEGTHAVMNRIFGRVGPVWYREGIAEILGTHRLTNGKLTLNTFPNDREEVPYWGRIKLIHDDVAKQGIRQIGELVDLPTRAFLSSDAYAWTWALQAFLHRRPEYSSLCDQLRQEMYHSERGVTERFLRGFQRQRAELDLDWNLFIQHLDYGYDCRHETIVHAASKIPLTDHITTRDIDAQKPWQSTGLRIPAKCQVEITAGGRFRIATEQSAEGKTIAWPCEPQGVTLKYYQGRPLGQLIAAIVPEDASSKASQFFANSIGRGATISSPTGGELFLRLNERADQMQDNAGTIKVQIRQLTEK